MPPKQADPKAKNPKVDPKAPAEAKLEEKEEAPKPVVRTGFGRFEYQIGTIYEGQWMEVNGVKMKHGEGYLVHAAASLHDVTREEYKGSWHEDKMHGFGIYKYISGAVYTGEWAHNLQEGKGTYEFPDGTLYSGEWKKHRMDGEGLFTDKNGTNWQGEFVEGVFQSKIQKKLKYDKMITQRKTEIEKAARGFLTNFKHVFEGADKKNYKEALLPFFSNSCLDELRSHLREPFVKYEEKKPEQWYDMINFLGEQPHINILMKNSSSRFLDQANILSQQFKGLGQIVEFDRITDERKTQLAICKLADDKWIVVYHTDIIEKPPAVKK